MRVVTIVVTIVALAVVGLYGVLQVLVWLVRIDLPISNSRFNDVADVIYWSGTALSGLAGVLGIIVAILRRRWLSVLLLPLFSVPPCQRTIHHLCPLLRHWRHRAGGVVARAPATGLPRLLWRSRPRSCPNTPICPGPCPDIPSCQRGSCDCLRHAIGLQWRERRGRRVQWTADRLTRCR